MNFESIAKIIIGSSLFAFVIKEAVGFFRKLNFKRKFIREIAQEFFANEFVIKFIIRDFQNLQRNPCGYLDRHRFMTQVINAVISSGFFVNLDFKLSQLILEFHQRFSNIQYELNTFFILTDEEKLKEQNLYHLERGESDSKKLLEDLKKSYTLKKLKKKYLLKWRKDRIKLREKKRKKKMNKKEKNKLIKELKIEVKKEIKNENISE